MRKKNLPIILLMSLFININSYSQLLTSNVYEFVGASVFYNNVFYSFGYKFGLSAFDTTGSFLFSKGWGGANTDTPGHLYMLNENGQNYFLVTGTSTSFDPFSNNIPMAYAVKMNAQGDTVWTHVYGYYGSGDLLFCRANDSNYIFSDVNGYGNFIKVNKNTGDTLWTKENVWQIGFYDRLVTFNNIFNDTNTLYACGLTYPNGDIKFMLMKADTLGTAQWVKTYGDTTTNICRGSTRCHDGGFILVGRSAPTVGLLDTLSYCDFLVVRTDINGDTLWCRRYMYNNNVDQAFSVKETNDHGFAILGTTINMNAPLPTYKTLLVKVDSTGNVEWSKLYSPGWPASFIDQLPTGNFLFLAGLMHITDSLGNDCLAQSVNVTMGYPQITISSINPVPRQGMQQCFRPYTQQYFYTPNLIDYCNFIGEQELSSAINEIKLFPNPVRDNLMVQCSRFKMEKVKIINVLGEKVMEEKTKRENEITIDVSKIKPGIYFLKVEREKGSVVKKFVKE